VGDKHFRPEEEEDVDKIVRAVMRGFDAELAVLLLLLSPSDSTGLKKSLDKVDLHNVLMVCIRVIHAIFQEDGSLVEGVLKQVAVVVLLRLGMENDHPHMPTRIRTHAYTHTHTCLHIPAGAHEL